MANEQNLKHNFTPSEARANGSKGGKKSAEVRRNKKRLKDCLEILLERKVLDENGEKITGAEAIAATVFKLALMGDLKAFELVRDTAGQKPVEKLVVSDVDPDIIAEVEAMVNDQDSKN